MFREEAMQKWRYGQDVAKIKARRARILFREGK